MFQKKLLKKEALLYEIETEAIFQEEFLIYIFTITPGGRKGVSLVEED